MIIIIQRNEIVWKCQPQGSRFMIYILYRPQKTKYAAYSKGQSSA